MTNQLTTQNQLATFTFEQHSIRTIVINDEPWFIAKDVCDAVNIVNYRDSIERLDEDEKGVALTDTLGGQQEMNIVSESGMYTLILRCRDAVKKGSVPHRFRKWVTAEVLPAIRKTGKYEHQKIEPEKTYSFDFTEYELQTLAWAWFIMVRNMQTFQEIYPAMETLGSRFAPAVWSQSYDYRPNIRRTHEIIERITLGFKYDPESSWRVLKNIRHFDPKKIEFFTV